jgi:argininosuccinate synthase
MERIVLAYSGSLDTSVAIPWLAETYHAEVVTVTVDLGQGRELEEVRDRALATGAVRAHVLDAREEFARHYVLRSLKAGAMDDDRCLPANALGRPLIAQKLVEIAEIEQAAAVAHGCGRHGPDHVRIGVTVRALSPTLKIILPAREWSMTPSEEIEYARQRGLPRPANCDSRYRTNSNLWGRSIEGVFEHLPAEPPEDIYTLTKSPPECPAEPAHIEMQFERGAPVALNGITMPLVELIGTLNTIAGAHGVGRIDIVGERLAGTTPRNVCEAPAATALHAAHNELQRLVTTTDLDRFARLVSAQYAEVVSSGLWFTPLREALDAFIDRVQEHVTGAVRLELFKGNCRIVGRSSPYALAEHALATGDSNGHFDRAATGLVKAFGLPVDAAAGNAPAAGNRSASLLNLGASKA